MSPKRCQKTFLLLLLLLFPYLNNPVLAGRNDMTGQQHSLGIPYKERYQTEANRYARNIWDMAVFENTIFLGAGNSSNKGPATNAGPVPVITLSPETNTFDTVYTVDDEQIDRFYIFDNYLFIPGHDPRGSWKTGNLYMTSDGSDWTQKRTIPNSIHAYDIINFKDMLFSGLGTKQGGGVVVSSDYGDSWRKAEIDSSRVYGLIVVDGTLYSVGNFYTQYVKDGYAAQGNILPHPVQEYTSNYSFKQRPDLSTREVFFPKGRYSEDQFTFLKITRHLSIENNCIYIGAFAHNDHQSLPFGLYIAESLKPNELSISQIPIPPNSIPWDLFHEDDTVYVLLDHPDRHPREVSVRSSNDLITWSEVFYFHAPTFARSFAKIGSTFYLGMGGEIKDPFNWEKSEISPHTGEILMINLELIQ